MENLNFLQTVICLKLTAYLSAVIICKGSKQTKPIKLSKMSHGDDQQMLLDGLRYLDSN